MRRVWGNDVQMTRAADGRSGGSLAGRISPGDDPAQVVAVVQDWIIDSVPAEWRDAAAAGDLARLHEVRTPAAYHRWYPVLGASGLVAPDWPISLGGLGLPAAASRAVLAVLQQWRLARLNIVGLSLVGPTLMEWGTPQQCARYLPRIVTNEEPWCQLFSEPGAGSDLAGMSTRAVRTADGWEVSGQKVWTSFAREARLGLLIARTNPDLPKNEGLSAFICDMATPQVVVRPLRKITGDTEFSEVFIDNLPVDASLQVGEDGDGWRIAQATLRHERQMLAGSGSGGRDRASGNSIERLVERAARTSSGGQGQAPLADDVFRDRLAQLFVESTTGRWVNERAATRRREGRPAVHPSAQKLMQSEHNQRLQMLALEVAGTDYLALPGEDDDSTGAVIYGFLRSRGDTIAGGTSEIQRNIVAERSLGMPRDPSDDRSIPWRDIPRGPTAR
jgi:alkylation response protein AidB-like acyl-CoA dehydrogenase